MTLRAATLRGATSFWMTARPLGLLLLVLALSMVLSGTLGFLADPALGWKAEETWDGFVMLLVAAGITAAPGFLLVLLGRGSSTRIGRREALFVVSVIWIGLGLFGALPFVIGAGLSWPDAIFEAFSGVTTTGATVLTDIEGRLSAPLHVWRMATHWLGGLGIVVLFVALLPSVGIGGKRLFQTEAAGPKAAGVTPRIRDTAKRLWWVYLAITFAAIVSLAIAGMPIFDAVTHAMSTLGTGGFSTKNQSIGAYGSVAIEMIVLVFMLLAGTNFGLFYRAQQEGLAVFWRSREFRLYVFLFVVVTSVIACDLWMQMDHRPDTALRYASFQVASVMTTTGFATANFEEWSAVSQILLLVLFFFGGMAGSTAGGMKLSRIIIMAKVVVHEIRLGFRPNLISPILIGDTPVADDVVRSTLAYGLIFCATVTTGGGVVAALDGVDLITAFTASLACVANVGPGLGAVGPTDHFGFFSDGCKLVLSGCMLLGRLEFFGLLALFAPAFWRG